MLGTLSFAGHIKGEPPKLEKQLQGTDEGSVVWLSPSPKGVAVAACLASGKVDIA